MIKKTKEQWQSDGQKMFGDSMKDWKFKCPQCGKVQSYKSVIKEMIDSAENPEKGGFTPARNFIVDGEYRIDVSCECTSHECDWKAYGDKKGPVEISDKAGSTEYKFEFASIDEPVHLGAGTKVNKYIKKEKIQKK